MIRTLRLLTPFLLVMCVFDAEASAQTSRPHSEAVGLSDHHEPFVSPYTPIQGMQEHFGQPTRNTFSLNLGPQMIEFKTSYLEKRQEGGLFADVPNPSNQGSYFDAIAKSSLLNGILGGEGELAYSTLGLTPTSEEAPKLMRLGLKGQWADLSYGADYRSVDHGFLFLTGDRSDQARDETQVWGEYGLGLFRLRGSLGELREQIMAANQLNLTRTGTTSLNFNRHGWSGMLYSSYSVIEQETSVSQKTLALTHGISASYRPATILTLEPNLSVKEEWDPKTGMRTETPSAALQLSSTPFQAIQLTGRASYARGKSDDGLKDIGTVITGAALNWQLVKSPASEKLLVFQLDYNNQLDFRYRYLSQDAVTGTLQFKIIGF